MSLRFPRTLGCAALALALATGCGGDETPAGGEATTPAAVTADTPPPAGDATAPTGAAEPKIRLSAEASKLFEDDAAWLDAHRGELFDKARDKIVEPDVDACIGLALLASRDDAIALLERGTRQSPDHALAWFLLGLSYQAGWDGYLSSEGDRRRLDDAADAFDKAAALEPNNLLYPLFTVANLHLAGEHDAALAELLTWPDHPDYHYDGWAVFRRVDDVLRLAELYDEATARRIAHGGDIPNYVPIQLALKQALPEDDPGADTLPDETLAGIRDAAVHAGRLMNGTELLIERAVGTALLGITTSRLRGIYTARGLTDALAALEPLDAERVKLRDAVDADIPTGKDSWWAAELRRLERQHQAGRLDDAAFEAARKPHWETMQRYFGEAAAY